MLPSNDDEACCIKNIILAAHEKTGFGTCKNKDTDRLRGNLISTFFPLLG